LAFQIISQKAESILKIYELFI